MNSLFKIININKNKFLVCSKIKKELFKREKEFIKLNGRLLFDVYENKLSWYALFNEKDREEVENYLEEENQKYENEMKNTRKKYHKHKSIATKSLDIPGRIDELDELFSKNNFVKEILCIIIFLVTMTFFVFNFASTMTRIISTNFYSFAFERLCSTTNFYTKYIYDFSRDIGCNVTRVLNRLCNFH